GVAAAAQIYFGDNLSDLTIAEAATLAGVLPAPSRYNPVSGPEYAKRRRGYVLGRMLDLGFIDEAEYQSAMDYPLQSKLHGPDIDLSAPYLAEMVRLQLVNRYGSEVTTRGYRVTTTIDSRMQRAANYAIRDGLLEYDRRHGFRGALTTVDLDTATDPDIEQALSDYAGPEGLHAALVTELHDDNSASMRLAADQKVRVPWSGMDWAAKFMDRNRITARPDAVTEVLAPGDVVYVIETITGMYALAQVPQAQGAIVALDPEDGAVAALAGGFDYRLSKFNRAVQADRQPGSSFKPFLYSAALANGFTTATVINDAPVVIQSSEYEGVWRPKNSTGRFYGPTRLRDAIVRSMNLVSVRMLRDLGIRAARNHMRQFGFDEDALPDNLSLALGAGAATPLEMASAYSIFANGGFRIEPYFIDRIELADGQLLEMATPARVCTACEEVIPDEPLSLESETATLVDPLVGEALLATLEPATIAPRVIPATNAWLIQDMLVDVIRRGSGRRARILGRSDIGGKTGTSNDLRDAWFAGFSPDLTAVAWVGFDSDEPLGAGEEGGRTALPMWIHFMRDALLGAPQRSRPQPEGLVTVRINPATGDLAGANERNFIFETFEAGTEPTMQPDDPALNPFGDDSEAVELDDVF
ncbi:MAG: penicillin-binding transpeptidase domain-containing protein, partial [Pseudomonadota bacterium]